jgi:hypothetical protein
MSGQCGGTTAASTPADLRNFLKPSVNFQSRSIIAYRFGRNQILSG